MNNVKLPQINIIQTWKCHMFLGYLRVSGADTVSIAGHVCDLGEFKTALIFFKLHEKY